MKWRIERYLLAEIIPYFLLAVFALTALVLASQMAEFAELFVKKDVPSELVRTMVLALIPRILVLTLPLSLLVAVMTGLGRLHGDHELIVLLTSGVGRQRLLVPLLLLALPTSALTFYLAAFDMPRSIRRLKATRAELILQGIRVHVKPRVFDDRFAGTVMYIGEIDRHTDLWRDIFLALEERAGAPHSDASPELVLITAARGQLRLGREPESAHLELYEGVIHRGSRAIFGSQRVTDRGSRYDVEAFERATLRFDVQSREAVRLQAERETGAPSPKERIQEMTLPELWAARRDPMLARRALTEFHKRLAVSFSPLALVSVGVALGTTRKRGGRGYGFWLSIVLAAVYYLLLLGGENLARAERVPPLLALWAANVLMLGYSAIRISERFSVILLIERMAERLRVTSATSPPLRTRLFAHWDHFRQRARQIEQQMLAHLSRRLKPRARSSPSSSTDSEHPVRSSLPIGDRYIASQFLSIYLTVLVGLWTLFVIFTLFELSSDILTHRIPARFVAEYLVFLTPSVLSYLAPPSALMAALVSMSILSKSGELTALRAAGVSIYRASIPIVMASLFLALAVALWQERILPEANARQEYLRFYIKKGRFPSDVELAPTPSAAQWMAWGPTTEPMSADSRTARPPRDPRGMPRRIVRFASLDRATGRAMAPVILEFSPERFLLRRRIDAEEAWWEASRAAWHLVRAFVWEFEGAHLRSQHHLDHFWLPDESGPELFAQRPRKPEAMTSRELRMHIRTLTERGLDAMDFRIVLERRPANAAAVVVLALFGIPFGLTFGRKGARQAIGLGLALGLLYWLALGFFEQLGRYEYLSPRVAAWSPNGLLAALGLFLLLRVRS